MLTKTQYQRLLRLMNRRNCAASRGDLTRQVEDLFCEIMGRKHALLVNSGTAALHLSLKALGIGYGDEVIVPNFTFSATALAVKHCGATPVFAGVTLPHGWIDLSSVKRLISERTKAIIPVHLNGYVGDMELLQSLALNHGLFVVEDACQALGSIKGRMYAGCFGDAGCFSFNALKQLPAGEGGIVVTDNEELLINCKRMMRFGDSGLERLAYDTRQVGWNYKMPEIVAAIILSQLPDLDRIVRKRRASWRSWEVWCENKSFTLPYKVGSESPWRICLIPTGTDFAVPPSLQKKESRWCNKPLSDQSFFCNERKDNAGMESLRTFLRSLLWIDISNKPPSKG